MATRRTLATVTPAELRERLSTAPPAAALRLAVLHGSRARRDATDGSDWDIGVLADDPPDMPALSATLTEILGTDEVDVVDFVGRVHCCAIARLATASPCWNAQRMNSSASSLRPFSSGATQRP